MHLAIVKRSGGNIITRGGFSAKRTGKLDIIERSISDQRYKNIVHEDLLRSFLDEIVLNISTFLNCYIVQFISYYTKLKKNYKKKPNTYRYCMFEYSSAPYISQYINHWKF